MKQNITYRTYIILTIGCFLLNACTTKKNTAVTRGYHNLVSHYNIYFNGMEAMKYGLDRVDQAPDDFTQILPIYKESNQALTNPVSGDMDVSIEKSLKLIQNHSITRKPNRNKMREAKYRKMVKKPEYNNWVDDSYIMMGRAYLYQHDYIRAIGTFTNVIRIFKDTEIQYDAYYWLVRSYIESERYVDAQELIESLEGDDSFPERLNGPMLISAADLNIRQYRYDDAIPYLDLGIKQIKGNKLKTRYTYILAQLYHETGKSLQALESYQNVIRRRPEYEMLFNARISSASVFAGEGDVDELRFQLRKMLRKKRNDQFQDQIYYALGTISENEGNEAEALDLYKQSAKYATNNLYQRALSCLTVADIYYDEQAYKTSHSYYDSAMVVLDETYPNYEDINTRFISLTTLTDNLYEVELQDSLQMLASLSEEDLSVKIDELIAAERERQAALEEELISGSGTSMYNSSRMQLNNSSSSWYYYNASTVAYGKKNFSTTWGNRKLADNWRRSDKSEISFEDLNQEGELTEELIDTVTRVIDPLEKEFYMQDIPTTDSLMAVSHNKIINSLYNAGNIFKTDFDDNVRSVECFKDLNDRYPGNMFELSSLFQLWGLYSEMNAVDSTEYYKDLIVDGYPGSNYAKFLLNPNYFIELEAQRDSLNRLYTKTFNAFVSMNFNDIPEYTHLMKQLEPDSVMYSKIRFFEMVSNGRTKARPVFADSVRQYIDTYAWAEPVGLAKTILTFIDEKTLDNYDQMVSSGYINALIQNPELRPKPSYEEDPFQGKWSYDNDLLHYFVLAIPNDDELVDVNRLKFDIANYNIDHYTMLDFDIETERLNEDTRLVVIRTFDGKDPALIYFLSIIRKPEVFKTLEGEQYINFVISSENYRELMADKSYNEYLKYFVANYSSFTTGDFPDDADYESPEEMMARLKAQQEKVEEKGDFVMIETENLAPVAPAAIVDENAYNGPFAIEYSEPHYFVVSVPQNFEKELVLTTSKFELFDESAYGYMSLRHENFRTSFGNRFMIVGTFPSGLSSLNYLKDVVYKPELFTNLDGIERRNFVISGSNLNLLKEECGVQDYVDFYVDYYINKEPIDVPVRKSEPAKSVKVVPKPSTQEKVNPADKEKQNTDQQVKTQKEEASVQAVVEEVPEQKEPVKPVAVVEETTEIKESVFTEEVETPKVEEQLEEEKPVAELAPVEAEVKETEPVKEPQKNVIEADEVVVPDVVPQTDGIYTYNQNSKQSVIFFIPTSGYNVATLQTAVKRFNITKYRSKGLKTEIKAFVDDYHVLVVSSLDSSIEAKRYLQGILSDARTKMAVKPLVQKPIIIGDDDVEKFFERKDIEEYNTFYSKYY